MPKEKIVTAAQKALCWAQNASKLKFRKLPSSLQKETLEKKDTTSSKTRYKSGWKELGDKKCFFRSKWEANYGCYLQWQKERGLISDWEHEPQTFWFEGIKRGCVSYLPDFKVIDNEGRVEWIEVKGYMDSKSKTKIKRFNKYYPQEKLRVIDSTWYKNNKNKLCFVVPKWEGK